jgi:uncharacterized protein YidB (DUF937 family)
MGLFDKVISGVLSKMMENVDPATIPGLVAKYVGQTEIGSVGGLLARLREAGLDREVESWLGADSNLPVLPDQLRGALGENALNQFASATGLSVDKLLALMSAHLPQTVDRMSPNGTIEEPAPQEEDASLAQQAGLDDIGRSRG